MEHSASQARYSSAQMRQSFWAGLGCYICIALFASTALAQSHSRPPRPNALEQARRLFGTGSYDRASLLLKAVLAANPQDADAHLLLGQIYAIQGLRTDTIQQLSRAIELSPSSAVAYNILGTALNRFAEFDAARKAFEQAVALDPQMAEARINLAMSLAESSDLEGAVQQLATAVKSHPTGPSAARAHYLLAKIYEDRSPAQAMQELETSSRLNPRDAQTWLELGSLRSDAGDEAGALASFQHAVSCAPKDPDTQYQLGSQYLAMADTRQAVVHLELARNLMRQPTIGLLYKLDRALRKSGNTQEAKAVSTQAKALLAQDVEANRNNEQAEGLEHEGLTLEDSGDLPGALRKLKAALEINPRENRYRYNYALVLCHLDRWTEGIAEFNEVLENDPGNIDARRALYIAIDKASQSVHSPASHPR